MSTVNASARIGEFVEVILSQLAYTASLFITAERDPITRMPTIRLVPLSKIFETSSECTDIRLAHMLVSVYENDNGKLRIIESTQRDSCGRVVVTENMLTGETYLSEYHPVNGLRTKQKSIRYKKCTGLHQITYNPVGNKPVWPIVPPNTDIEYDSFARCIHQIASTNDAGTLTSLRTIIPTGGSTPLRTIIPTGGSTPLDMIECLVTYAAADGLVASEIVVNQFDPPENTQKAVACKKQLMHSLVVKLNPDGTIASCAYDMPYGIEKSLTCEYNGRNLVSVTYRELDGGALKELANLRYTYQKVTELM